MAENVKVIVRCRPMNEKERNMKCKVFEIEVIKSFIKKIIHIYFENVNYMLDSIHFK